MMSGNWPIKFALNIITPILKLKPLPTSAIFIWQRILMNMVFPPMGIGFFKISAEILL